MNIATRLITALLFFLSLSSQIQLLQAQPFLAQQFHVLLSADTLTEVKHASKKDLKHMKNELFFASKAIGMSLKLSELSGMKLTKKKLFTWIEDTNVAPGDIVLLYYTGHGLRTERSSTIWPFLYFPAREEIIDTQYLIQKLVDRQPSLVIVLIDCCNNFISENTIQELLDPKALFVGRTKSALHSGYRKLFLQTQGLIVASGSIPGKRSWATPKGGVFTNAFLCSLRHELGEKQPRWNHILNKTKRLCSNFQKPQFQMQLNDSQK